MQLTGLLAKTGVGQVRRTARAILIGLLHRRFNPWGLEKKNAMRKEEGEKPVKSLRGRDKMALFFQYLDEVAFKKADKAKKT